MEQTFEIYWLKNAAKLRYGQAFCNYYEITDPALFYEKDETTAREKAAIYIANWQLN